MTVNWGERNRLTSNAWQHVIVPIQGLFLGPFMAHLSVSLLGSIHSLYKSLKRPTGVQLSMSSCVFFFLQLQDLTINVQTSNIFYNESRLDAEVISSLQRTT